MWKLTSFKYSQKYKMAKYLKLDDYKKKTANA